MIAAIAIRFKNTRKPHCKKGVMDNYKFLYLSTTMFFYTFMDNYK